MKNKINSFFIFNSTFGPTEGEELKRILFFYPNQISSDARKMQVGLCEAVVKFMTTFSSEPCEALQTQTKRYIFYQPEKNFWMVLVNIVLIYNLQTNLAKYISVAFSGSKNTICNKKCIQP